MIREEMQTKVCKQYDVAVCGGGFAGIAAALAARREGKSVVLFERQFMLGGLGTAGIVTIYLPLCDGVGKQVCFGIAEELFRLSISMGHEDRYPANWLDGVGAKDALSPRFEVQYNPQLFAILAERLLLSEGVDILYGTYAVGVNMLDTKIKHIITESKTGRVAYGVGSVVDATGDCDIAKFASAPTATFDQGNVLAAWYYYVGKDGYKLNMHGFCDIPDEDKGKGGASEALNLSKRRFEGLDSGEISEYMCSSHNAMYNDIVLHKKLDADFMPVTIPTIPQLRMTRRIVGEYEMTTADDHKHMNDSVGLVPNWKKRGPVYEVPFGALYSRVVKNLICAGRCISANDAMWDVMRVIPCCAVTGQAAGIAAAMTDDFSKISLAALQAKLRDAGVKLHVDEI